MKIRQQVRAAASIVTSRLTGRPIPVAVRWNLLHRCPNRCGYCNLWRRPAPELPADVIVPRLSDFAALGTTRISFSGGEPLLRKDIGRLVSAAADCGLSATMNSSGFGLHRRIDELSDLDLLKISLDGPEEVHDRTRGRQGAHRTALAAADLARNRLKKVTFAATLSRHNLAHLDYLVDTARRFDTVVAFQPLKTLYRGLRDLDQLAPAPKDFQRAVERLIRWKRGGEHTVRNSLAELEHMRFWPAYPPLPCSAGKIFVMVDPDGTLLPCDRIDYDAPLPNVTRGALSESVRALPPVRCGGCAFCGALQLNLFYASRSWPIRDVLRFVN